MKTLNFNKKTDNDFEKNITLNLDLNNELDYVELVLNDKSEVMLRDDKSRCVSVDTILNAPGGRIGKKSFKAKSQIIKFRCTSIEKKLLKNKAKNCGISLSEYFRRVAFNQEIKERLNKDEIEIYRMLVQYHNNFKAIGNMYRKKNPSLTKAVYELANEIKTHLKKFQK